MKLRFLLVALFALSGARASAAAPPNIVFILADDLGYGDVRCLNAGGKIATPQLDRLRAGGMAFTYAHSSSAVCTPTRYGLLTGRYNWRSRLKSGVLGGMSPPLIEPGRLTVAEFLHAQGYKTACIGKWHLGMDWERKAESAAFNDGIEKGEDGWRVDFTKPIAHGPTAYGFDTFFGIAASLDMVPYTFIENDRVAKVPTEDKAFPMMFGREGKMTRKGPGAADFTATEVLPALTQHSVDYIGSRADEAKKGTPFFLYLPLNAPHTPIAPSTEWQGKSGLNPYADFVMQTDATVGAVLDALDRHGLAANTLVFFASDNGCSPEAKFDELLAKEHNPSAQFRGTKADIFDGGHRIPLLVRWPGRVKAGSTSEQTVCLNDFFATCAEVVGARLPDTAAEDSVSLLPVLEGRATAPLHEAVVHHSINGSFAVRAGNWKLVLAPGSGGWSAPKPGTAAEKALPPIQLYDLSDDIGEKNNVQAAHPEVVARLTALLEKYVAGGRSTPGAMQPNTTPVVIQPRAAKTAAKAPNIVLILSDDLGYGDTGCYGATAVKTPNIDRLAREGLRFTDAHTTSATCTPSRFSLLTGQYAFRQKGTGVLPGDAALIIAPGRLTLPLMLRQAGYRTGVVGKWHLGLGTGGVDWNTDVKPGPLEVGFTDSYIMAATGDRVPCVFVDRHRVVKLESSDPIAVSYAGKIGTEPTGRENPELLRMHPSHGHDQTIINGISRIGYMTGGKTARWVDENLPDTFLREAQGFIERSKDAPFFLYYATHEPHVPRVPHPRFIGETKMGPRGDAIAQLDWSVGEILATLDRLGLAGNTLVLFSSDNGPVVDDGYRDEAVAKLGEHQPAGVLRGGKYSNFEGGTRVPFIVRWPARVKPGVSAALVCQVDLLASFAALTGQTLPADAAPDSFDVLPALLGEAAQGRDHLIEHAAQTALRAGPWKYIPPGKGAKVTASTNTETGIDPAPQLYDLTADPGETRNLAAKQPERAAEMAARLERIKAAGRSRP